MNRTIHYCWFGKTEKSDVIKKCIDSWREFLPNYEIKEWNEDNFDVHCCKYVEEAYEAKKWAFVSDYCRMWVLYMYGGVYFDTDVEVIKATDVFESNCIGFEKKKLLNPGLVLSAEKGNWFCHEMLSEYDRDSFFLEGGQNFRTVCDRATSIFLKHGLKLNNKMQKIDGFTVYPSDFFNPLGVANGTLKITDNTLTVHLFAGSWVDGKYLASTKKSFKNRIYKLLTRFFGRNFADWVRRLVNK